MHTDDEKDNLPFSPDEIERLLKEKLDIRHIDRRKLISSCLKITGCAILSGLLLSDDKSSIADVRWLMGDEKSNSSKPNVKSKTTIVQVSDPKSVDSSGEGIEGPVMDMITKAILELTDEKDITNAWGRIAMPGQRVGIKVNAISGRHLSTQIPVVMAIVEGLKMSGVKERDIIIWDKTSRKLERAGFQLNANTDSIRCVGTNKIGYQDDEQDVNGTKFKLSKILTEEIDVLINVPIMKNHDNAGVTLSLKNNYGSHNNPSDHHKNNCDPDMANINSHEIIRSKTKLIVLDALRAQCNGGPGDKPRWKWNPGMILMGFDPVAIDRTGSDIIESRRLEMGLKSLGNSHRHIITAAKLGLGNDDRRLISLKKI